MRLELFEPHEFLAAYRTNADRILRHWPCRVSPAMTFETNTSLTRRDENGALELFVRHL